MRTGRPPRPLEERFREKFTEGDPDTCWMWKGAVHPQGYGLVKRKDGAQMRANRVSWEVYRGPIPEGMMVLHRCDNPGCVNPDHLFLGNQRDNMDDMRKKGRKASTQGENNGAHKLSEREVLEILDTPGAQHRIAKKYGVCQMTVSLIKQGKRWGTLTQSL
ncbi:MAG: HNH endonuclease signature motif containing protein [Methanoregula sp.]|jgi:hypothetical protein